jgi:hypothetical protein
MGFSLGGSGRGIRFLDALMLIWVFTWVALGIAVFQEVGNLRQLSDTEVAAGRAIVQTGNALQPLEQLPFVGGRIGSVRQQVIAAGRSAEQSGEASRQTVGQLSILLGLSVGLIPTVPAFAIYGPLRLSWVRDVRAVRRTLAKHRGEVTFQEFLARRAAQNLPYHKLREISENPWRDLEAGRFDALAQAELRRLGLRQNAFSSRPKAAAAPQVGPLAAANDQPQPAQNTRPQPRSTQFEQPSKSA